MIARIWRGTTRIADRETYHEYMKKTGLREYLACKGNRGVKLLRRDLPDKKQTEFVFITFWDSYDALREFAGEDYERAVYYPEDERFLVEAAPTAIHFDVLESVTRT
jgi:heme-degrading monooxygenase HmoA